MYFACSLHMMWTISMPERIVAAQAIDLKAWTGGSQPWH